MTIVPARSSAAFTLESGRALRVINTHGSQVADTWLIAAADGSEYASMAHTRATLAKLWPQRGDHIFSNRRRPLATIVADTSGGIHDTLIPACDQERYALLGHVGPHDNCADNFQLARERAGIAPMPVPDPLNLFMNVPVGPSAELTFEPPVSRPGSYVTIVAEITLTVIISACPQDLVPVNGKLQSPTDIEVELLDQLTTATSR